MLVIITKGTIYRYIIVTIIPVNKDLEYKFTDKEALPGTIFPEKVYSIWQ